MISNRQEKIFHGNAVSPGIVLGHALKLDSRNRVVLKLRLEDDQIEGEVRRVEQAIRISREQIELLKSRLAEKVGPEHSFILDVHLLMLEDRSFISEIGATIRKNRVNAEWAVRRVTDRIRNAYASIEDEYFRDRGIEIENIVERVLYNLSGDKPFDWTGVPDDLIVVSHSFNPSSFAIMDLNKLRGLALESGGRTSHTAIISRGLRLPSIMGIRNFLPSISTGDLLLMDAEEGQLIVHPTEERLNSARGRLEHYAAAVERVVHHGAESATTRDGVHIALRANTDLPHEVRAAKRCGAEGIGLFRTEFLFFAYPQGVPDIKAQLETYRMLAEEMCPHPVCVRTLDTGGEKTAGNGLIPDSSMGLRGIRLSLMEKEAFQDQIEAIMRASNHGRIEIVLPMVTTVEEIREAKDLIGQVRSRVSPALKESTAPVPVGVMLEVPAAVFALESIAPAVDFLCVGTNDLIQYMLAVDRGNPYVSHLFQPLHPSVLRCLQRISEVCRDLNKPVRICGEISSNPFFAILLLGLGFSDLSMNAFSIPTVRRVVREVSIEQAREVASAAMKFPSAQETGEFLIDAVSRMIRMDLSPYVKEVRAPGGRENRSGA